METVNETDNLITNDGSDAVFELDRVSKIYKNEGKDFTALRDVSFTIREGEIFGIIGMSGAGKSTLVRTLNRLTDVTSGSVRYFGRDLAELKARELRKVRRSIAMIFQGFNLLQQRSVIKNVEQPLRIAGVGRRERKEIARRMLEVVGLSEKEKEYPARLSGGQRQRVAIARALAANPKVLLCDEATSALDPKITGEILELLQKINREQKLTIVIITHEMSVVERICDRVAIIDDGNLAEVGDVKEVFRAPKSRAAKKLVFPSNPYDPSDENSRLIRIAFDGLSAKEPFIADLVATTGQKVNILSANTKSVGGVGYGQMVLELPPDEKDRAVVVEYFRSQGLAISEVDE
ncbi:MAG: methionine ABC transporter ATP-binding protein [Lachnospiraceae bacterium]|nr:methionine ABC transporter ATP-binding protein [Lachnospiraceae bacterium]